MPGIRFPESSRQFGPPDLTLQLDGLTLRGVSLAARATGFTVEELGIALDLGRMSPLVAQQPIVLLTHGHLDHMAAILAYLNLRARFHRDEPPRILAPAALTADLCHALSLMPGLEPVRRRLDLEAVFIGVEAGEMYRVGGLEVRAFSVDHGVPALGWAVGREGARRPDLVYAGDSSTVPFEADPTLLDARVAVVECTFIEPNRRVAARLARHAHIFDWVEVAPRLSCDTLVLAHLPELAAGELARLAASLARGLPGDLVLWSPCPDSGPSAGSL